MKEVLCNRRWCKAVLGYFDDEGTFVFTIRRRCFLLSEKSLKIPCWKNRHINEVRLRDKGYDLLANPTHVDKDGLIIKWPCEMERLLGYRKDEVLGRHINLIVPESHKQEIKSVIDRMCQEKALQIIKTLRMHKCGGLLNVEVTLIPIFGGDRVLIGVDSFTRMVG